MSFELQSTPKTTKTTKYVTVEQDGDDVLVRVNGEIVVVLDGENNEIAVYRNSQGVKGGLNVRFGEE